MLVGLVINFLSFKMAVPILWAAVKVIRLEVCQLFSFAIIFHLLTFLILSSIWWPISYDYRLWVNWLVSHIY